MLEIGRIIHMIKLRLGGFTAIEILMTIGLIAIVSAVGVTQYINYKDDARRATTQKAITELKSIIRGNSELTINGQFAMQGYLTDMGRYPASLDELVVKGAQADFNPHIKKGWKGPYVNPNVNNWNLDGWGTALLYDNSELTITSCGPDKICGDANAADDIVMTMGAETSYAFSSISSSAPTAVNGGWSAWTTWADITSCTGVCDTGSKDQRRTRSCNNPAPAYGGSPCSGLTNEIQTVSCPLDPCPVDGGWSGWSAWADTGACSAACGGGTLPQERTRTCTNPAPAHGGASCVGASTDTQSIACNVGACPVNGGWSATTQTTVGSIIYDVQRCNNPVPANGGLTCPITVGWSEILASSPKEQRRASSCTNGATLASSCTACSVGQAFLASGSCGACAGNLVYNNTSIGSVGSGTSVGSPTTCSVTFNGTVRIYGAVTVQAATVTVNGIINGTGGGHYGGAGGAGGRGGGSNGAVGNPSAGNNGTAGNGVGGSAGDRGTLPNQCTGTPCSGADGNNGTAGGPGSHATGQGIQGGGGGGGGGGSGGRAGRIRNNANCSSGSWVYKLDGGGGGGGGAGGQGGAALVIQTYALLGAGSILSLGVQTGGNGGNGGDPTATAGGNPGNFGDPQSNGGSNGGDRGGRQNGCSRTSGFGGAGGNGGRGGDGSVAFGYNGAKAHSISVNVGSGYFTNN